MAYIYPPKKLKNKKWSVRVQFKDRELSDKPIYRRITHQNRTKAQKAAQAMVDQYDAGNFDPRIDRFVIQEKNNDKTIREAIEEYIAFKQSPECKNPWNTEYSVHNAGYKIRRLRDHIDSERSIYDISQEELNEFINQPQMKSYYSRKSYFVSVRSFLNWLRDKYGTGNNIELNINAPKNERPPKYLTRSEVDQIKKTVCQFNRNKQGKAKRYALHYIRIVEFLFQTGLRRSEFIRLRVRDVNLEDRIIYVRNSKGARDEYLPIVNESLMKILRAQYRDLKLRGDARPDARFFPYPPQPESLSHYIKKLIRLSLPPESQYKVLHSFRHGTGTYLAQQGVRIETIRKYLRHKHVATTEIYSKIQDTVMIDEIKDAFNKNK